MSAIFQDELWGKHQVVCRSTKCQSSTKNNSIFKLIRTEIIIQACTEGPRLIPIFGPNSQWSGQYGKIQLNTTTNSSTYAMAKNFLPVAKFA